MKTKKLLIIAGILILTAAIVSVGVYSANKIGGDEAEVPVTEETKPIIVTKVNYPEDQKREEADPTKKIITVSGEEIELSYEYTDTRNRFITEAGDVYVDGSGSEYYFTTEGVMVGYRARLPHNVSLDDKLSEDEIIKIANQYGKVYFGDKFEGYVIDDIFFTELDKDYSLSFERKYGEDEFATGEKIDMTIMCDGRLYCCVIRNYGEMKDFDASLLDGVTFETAEEYAKSQAAELFPDLKDIWVNNIRIVKKDGKYTLQLCYNHITENYPSDEMQTKYNINVLMTMDRCEFAMNYYYPLEE